MSDEELLIWAEELRQANFKAYPRLTLFLSPIWNATREQFEDHSFKPGISGLTDCIRAAAAHRPLALAMLREFHTQYALQVLIS